jgi:hypothetical protein
MNDRNHVYLCGDDFAGNSLASGTMLDLDVSADFLRGGMTVAGVIVVYDVTVANMILHGAFTEGDMLSDDAIVGGGMIVAVDCDVAQEPANVSGADCKTKYGSAHRGAGVSMALPVFLCFSAYLMSAHQSSFSTAGMKSWKRDHPRPSVALRSRSDGLSSSLAIRERAARPAPLARLGKAQADSRRLLETQPAWAAR